MRLFLKLFLLITYLSVINPGYTTQVVEGDLHPQDPHLGSAVKQSAFAKFLDRSFKDDKSESPLLGTTDNGSRLIESVVGYIRKGNEEHLRKLFHQPDFKAWIIFYRQITQEEQFSTIDLIDLLDQTKTRIFEAYSQKSVNDNNAYIYINTLFDHLIQQIFAGCWGISKQPTPDKIIDDLKGVYGRVVSGLATIHEYYPLHIIKTLELKKADSSSNNEEAHFTALQECAASVYSHLRSASGVGHYSADDFRKTTNILFSATSFEKTLGQIHYQDPLKNIYSCTNFKSTAWNIINPEEIPFRIPRLDYLRRTIFHPSIVEWEDVYTAYYNSSNWFFAKAEDQWWIWSKDFGWSQKLPGWKPIKDKEEILERVKAALNNKVGSAEEIELTAEQFSPFHFSTVAKFKDSFGERKIYWLVQKPDHFPEISYLGDARLNSFVSWIGNTFAWQTPDKKWRLMRFNGDALDRWVGEFFPPEGYSELLSYISKGYGFEIKVKKTDSDEIIYWSYNTNTESWTQLSENDREFSFSETQERIKAQYPSIGINFFSVSSEQTLASFCDPLAVTQEKFVILTRDSGKSSYSERPLFVAQSDTIKTFPGRDSTFVVYYKDLNGKACVKKIVKNSLEEVLPPHPTITDWDKVELNNQSEFLFASHAIDQGRKVQYWALKEGSWQLLQQSNRWIEDLVKVYCGQTQRVYKAIYEGDKLTLEFLNQEALTFEPTNVKQVTVSVIDQENFIASENDPHIILALQSYQNGVTDWTFLNDAISDQYKEFLTKLRLEWTAEDKPFANAPLSIKYLKLNGNKIHEALFWLYQDTALRGNATLHEGKISVEWEQTKDKVFLPLHPPFQTHWAKAKDHDVPYYYVPPTDGKNGKTVIFMDGGPNSHYEGGYSDMVSHYTLNGWGVIIPQESLRTGYGWKHFSKGLGEMGRKNLHQLLHVFYDAHAKGLVPDLNQVSLYGFSYGGFVATSFALRWSELHKEAGLEEQFHFQSIIADGALINNPLQSDPSLLSLLLPDDKLDKPEDYFQKVMPINRTANPLSAPLYIIHGKVDVRCSATHMQDFIKGLTAAGKNVPLFWHSGGHCPPDHARYPEFVETLMEAETAGKLGRVQALALEVGLSIE